VISYHVLRIPAKTAKEYIHKNHYTHGSSGGPSPCYGLFDGESLIGVLMFATPISEDVRKCVFGPEHKDRVTELHRLHIIDGTPKNTESFFIAECLRRVVVDRPQTRAVVSFADSTMGHRGTIYRATNALFYGMVRPSKSYITPEGRLRPEKIDGIHVKGEALGWVAVKRGEKYRYVWIVGDRRERKKYAPLLRLVTKPYPKEEAA
jgi:hypothetical protein